MPQTSVVFSSVLGPSCSGQVQPGMGERGGGVGSSGDLVFQDGRLISGSLEALMEHLVPTVDYYPDRTYIFTFLLSSRVFIPPHDLLARVGQICLEQRQQLEAGSDKAKLKSFSAKIVQLLKEWTEAFPYDFQDEKAMAELKAITHRVTQCDEENGTVKKAIAQMTQSLLLSLAARSQLQELREKLRSPAMDKGPILKAKPPAAQKDILGVCCDPLVLAQQLTHIELERVSSIHPEDLMQIVSHMDSRDKHRCRGDLIKTYSLEAYDNWFNCLSMLVATEVCRVVKKKHRTRMLEFFIDVARECFNIGNFNSMMAIICECVGPRGSPSSTVWPISSRPDPSCRPPAAGMNLSPVARLKKTWSKVKTAKFDVLEHHMDPSSNFCNYRTALQGATQRSQMANSSREKIVIPVFNLFVKDIYFLHKIHTNHLPNGHINFKKFWDISRQIHEFMTWTQVECPFEKDKKIQSYLLTAPIYSEEALFIASFESEGPENHMEKDSWKTLRTTLLNRA
ncbi:ras-GEF domain-containing family member 1A isoform X2 [Orcinus orca]|nr:ras-GEF domain-containing family member 1A isoform X2 [Orcinus orca]XP_049552612.1 ras-GEF domain-containing family member 1A isoform X2 [Orcinus orca]XP_049552613.1 ras-GEF domain-containing family member 1A isoform X2 [Orcinus orca]XP_049552614.1 ras-GEF domain-containing family member 1A isoform X2 [Orcinus orca]XP_049552615.1 ras-GEF domain-containing family member 1A isoform X2 [Orcinus orca]XP_049552616.1 ras-GEF domain-containing family member 1A isoform X2 [Orcinus orca]XP_04955261